MTHDNESWNVGLDDDEVEEKMLLLQMTNL